MGAISSAQSVSENILIPFDQNGVLGPVVTLLRRCNQYNFEQISKVISILKDKYSDRTKRSPVGEDALLKFIAQKRKDNEVVTSTELVGTAFFQAMQKKGPYHDAVCNFLAPRMFNATAAQISAETIFSDSISLDNANVREWAAQFVQSYLPEAMIAEHCKLIHINPAALKKRTEVGVILNQAADNKELSECDLNCIIDGLNDFDYNFKNLPLLVQSTIIGLREAIAIEEKDPNLLKQDIIDRYNIEFRQKHFS